ncbi:PEP-CTERM sorting domain-containing protein [Neorhodopirellula lusitana]
MAVPEPAVLAFCGIAGLGFWVRRNRQKEQR